MTDSVVFIGPQRPVMETLHPLWEELGFEEQRFAGGDAAIEVVRDQDAPRAVLISLPLWDTSLEELLSGLERAIGRQQCSRLVILAPEAELSGLQSLELRGVSVLSEESDPAQLREAVKGILDRPQRAHPRFMVQIAVEVGAGHLLRACQSENISISGMLIRTSEEFPVGTSLQLSFVLPEHNRAIRCHAEVVRLTRPEVEGLRGMGLRFLSFFGDGEERLQAFLARHR